MGDREERFRLIRVDTDHSDIEDIKCYTAGLISLLNLKPNKVRKKGEGKVERFIETRERGNYI